MRQQKEIQKALQTTLYFLRCLSSELRTENSDTGRLLTFSQGFLEELRGYLSHPGRLDMRKAACIVHGAENNACVIQADKIN
jgi:hypothetical protein